MVWRSPSASARLQPSRFTGAELGLCSSTHSPALSATALGSARNSVMSRRGAGVGVSAWAWSGRRGSQCGQRGAGGWDQRCRGGGSCDYRRRRRGWDGERACAVGADVAVVVAQGVFVGVGRTGKGSVSVAGQWHAAVAVIVSNGVSVGVGSTETVRSALRMLWMPPLANGVSVGVGSTGAGAVEVAVVVDCSRCC